jgi:hypothetical protein
MSAAQKKEGEFYMAKTPEVTRSDVKKELERTFIQLAALHANQIQIEVDGGKVILRGIVRAWIEKTDAEVAALGVPGVTGVVNRLEVTPLLQGKEMPVLTGIQISGNDDEKKNLIWQHQAIRTHAKVLIDSFKSVKELPSEMKAIPTELNDLIRFYLWPLYAFREMLQRHIAFDKSVFNLYQLGSSLKNFSEEHAEIQQLVEDAIQKTEKTVYGKLTQEELDRSASTIRDTLNKLSKIIEAHTAEEDKILKKR